jgi:hypothetical protein
MRRSTPRAFSRRHRERRNVQFTEKNENSKQHAALRLTVFASPK